jgi:hypothetical protein
MSERRWRRRRCGPLVVGLFVLGATGSAQAADTIYGTTGQRLVRFSSASPGSIEVTKPFGLGGGDSIVAIDVRPATGELMGLGSDAHLYRIDPRSGAATDIGAAGSLTGVRWGIDFDPTVDRLRIVTDAEQNLRQSPLDGTVVSGANLSPPGNVVSVAYDRNTAGAAQTTLFGLDSVTDELIRIGGVDGSPSPTLGAVTEIGASGVDFDAGAGFDISGSDGTAYASLTAGGATSLYTVDLTTGAATKVADLGNAAVNDIAVAQPGYTYYTFASGTTTLISGHSGVPGPVGSDSIPVSGFATFESIVGLDQRPATGDLVALTNENRLYLVDPVAGAAVRIGTAPLSPAVGSTSLGFDFNPVADRIRVVGDNEINLRLDPVAGTLVATDNSLTPVGNVTAAAYLNSYPGATTTLLYDIDSGSDSLLIQNPPNNGTLTTIGALKTTAGGDPPPVDIAAVNGFDIAPAGGFGFLLSRTGGGFMRLFRVNLASGDVTGGRIVQVGPGSVGSDPAGLAVMSPGLLSTGATTAIETGGSVKVIVLRTGGQSGPATVEYSTADGSATAGADYTATSGVLRFADGQQIGLIDVPLLDDAGAEETETFTITLSKPGEGALLGAAEATVSLASDDAAPSPSPSPAPAVPDTTEPLAFVTVRAAQTIKTVRSKGLRLQVVAGEPATATITATIDKATAKRLKLKRRTVASGKAAFTAAGVRSVRLKLGAKAKRALRKSKKPVRVRVSATITDLAGNASKATASAVLPVK